MHIRLAALALALTTATFGQVETDHPGPVVRMRPCTTAPVVDGSITDAEWAEALVTEGTVDSKHAVLDPRQAWLYFTFDQHNLYFGLKTETHPGNRLHFWPHRPDVMTGSADGIEIWIARLPAPTAAPVDLFQLWFDPGGAFWGMVQRYGAGFDFEGRVQKANRLADDFWHFELAVPWAELGVKGDPVEAGAHFLIRPTRNWRYSFRYASFGNEGAFREPSSMMRVIVDPQAPVVQVAGLGEIAYGRADVEVKLGNFSSAPEEYQAQIVLQDLRPTEPRVLATTEKRLSLAPGAWDRIGLKAEFAPADRSGQPSHRLTIGVTRTRDGAICYRRTIGLAASPANPWQTLPTRAVTLRGGYYPYYHRVYAEVDLGDFEQADKVTRAVVRVCPANSDRVLGQGEITQFEYNKGSTVLEVPDLPEGEYTMLADLYAGQTKLALAQPEPVARQFVRRKLPWEHNSLGITDKVYPPFTPLTVRGNRISCVLREHTINGLGLWDQVASMGVELLAAPMRLECTADGKSLEWSLLRQPRFTRMAVHQVVHEGEASCAKAAVRTTCTWDYDGMMKVEMTVEARGDGKVDELALVIPFNDRQAPLYHVTTFLRGNPAGRVPAGQDIVWDSTKLVQTLGLGTFAPYIWVGGPERGIAWCADNDKGWITSDKEADFQLVRRGDELQLRIRLINAPATIRDARHIVFGVQATPTKPQPPDFRGWLAKREAASRSIVYDLQSWKFGGLSNCESLDPLGGDWSVIERLAQVQRTGKVDLSEKGGQRGPDLEWIDNWLGKHGEGQNKELRDMLISLFRRTPNADWLVIYTNPALEGGSTPQYETFKQEWRGQASGIAGHMTRSYVDYAVWCFGQMFEHGLKCGLYHDNTFPMVSEDTVSGNAYVRDDGKVQAGWDMWAHRELYKRLYAMAWERTGEWPLLAVHLTNSNNVTYFSFATIGFDLEWEYYTDRTMQEKFSFDLLQVESTGKQAGVKPMILCRQGGGPKSQVLPTDSPEVKAEKQAFAQYLERTRVGVCFLHDMYPLGSYALYDALCYSLCQLGFGSSDCEFIPYWRNEEAVAQASPGIAVSVYKLRQAAVAVACSVDAKDGTYRLKLNLDKLGLPPNAEAIDYEALQQSQTPAKPPAQQLALAAPLRALSPGEVEFSLRRHDFRLILFRQ